MADFMLYALLAGLGVAAIAGPLGAFVVWRRMAYFGDTLAHSALLGIALGIALDLNLNLAIVIACLCIATLLVTLQQKRIIATDTLLGILAHSSLALGVVTVGLLDMPIDLIGYLFGDMLTVTNQDLTWIIGGIVLVSTLLIIFWRPLLAITIHEELAEAEGYAVLRLRLLLMLLIAMVIAVAMKIVGVLLITALLIIPAATARRVASSPEQMAIFASGIGMLAVVMGLSASVHWDTAAGPSVVLSSTLIFLVVYLLPLHSASARR